MAVVLRARFNGQVIVPDEPLDLPAGTPIEVEVRVVSENDKVSDAAFAPLYQMIGLAELGPEDASVHHDLRPEEPAH
ncbi:hypothetical protein HRbin16_00948 [bacterium HR16]|nr:hypothetical protein HRbin16_00948 [bacterium HR16]